MLLTALESCLSKCPACSKLSACYIKIVKVESLMIPDASPLGFKRQTHIHTGFTIQRCVVYGTHSRCGLGWGCHCVRVYYTSTEDHQHDNEVCIRRWWTEVLRQWPRGKCPPCQVWAAVSRGPAPTATRSRWAWIDNELSIAPRVQLMYININYSCCGGGCVAWCPWTALITSWLATRAGQEEKHPITSFTAHVQVRNRRAFSEKSFVKAFCRETSEVR